MENDGRFKWWHVAIGMVAAAVLTASFAPSPGTSDQWINCDNFRKSIDKKYTGTVHESHIYFETVGGHRGPNGSNFLLSWDNANMSRDIPFEFTETIRAKCENGEVEISNFYWPAEESGLNEGENSG